MNATLLAMAFRPASAPQIVVTSDWPEDAEIINAEWDFAKRQVRLIVASATFDDVLPGYHAPEWSPSFTARDISRSLMDVFENMEKESRSGA